MPDETVWKEKRNVVRLPENALVKESEEAGYALFSMPRGSAYSGYRFIAKLNEVTKNDDGTVSFTLNGDYLRVRANGEKMRISADEAVAVFVNSKAEDYLPERYKTEIPADAVNAKFTKGTRLLMPYNSEYKGCLCTVPNDNIKETESGIVLDMPDWQQIPVKYPDGRRTHVSARELSNLMEQGKDSYADRKHWVTVTVSKEAILDKHEKQTRLRMPDGKYGGCTYYIPNGMIKDNKDGTVTVMLPETRGVYIKDIDGNKTALTAKDFKSEVDKKGAEKYAGLNKADVDQFTRKMMELKEHLPQDMVETPNWVDVRIKTDKDGREYTSTSMNRVAAIGRDLPVNTGHSFEEAAEYGTKHKSDTLGFKFTGDGVVCLSVGNCLDSMGKPNNSNAQMLLDAAKNTYVERSSDGKDVHIFGIMPGLNKEHISKDGTLELYSGADYVAITGRALTHVDCLEVFGEGSRIKSFIDSQFEDAKEIEPMTKSDQKLLDAAKANEKSGAVFSSLYAGNNAKGSAAFCDENLMMRLACRTKGDTEAMRRIYAASERADRAPEHIDHLAVRSKKNTQSFVEEMKATERRARKHVARQRDEYASTNYNSGYKR